MRKIFIFKITKKKKQQPKTVQSKDFYLLLLNQISQSLSAPLIFEYIKTNIQIQVSKTGAIGCVIAFVVCSNRKRKFLFKVDIFYQFVVNVSIISLPVHGTN